MDIAAKKKLSEKGWKKEDLMYVDHLMKEDNKKHHHIKQHLNHISFLTLTLGVVIVNLIMAVFVVPFILLLQGPLVYAAAVVFGFLMGIFFKFLMLELEGLEEEHHTIILLLVPVMAFIDIMIINALLDWLGVLFTVSYKYETAVWLFMICFLTPYIVYHVWQKKQSARVY